MVVGAMKIDRHSKEDKVSEWEGVILLQGSLGRPF